MLSSPRKPATVYFRTTADDARQLRAYAQGLDVTVSTLVRAIVAEKLAHARVDGFLALQSTTSLKLDL